jgi:radical SAM protein with 4Fe4S-binding SPASM domain
MAFTVFEEGRAPGTPEHYRIGDVFASPVIDVERLADVSQIRNDQMKPPAGYDCTTCVARASCFGGCHCRLVGGDGIDPAYRFGVPLGLCESMVASVTGMLRGAAIARRVAPVAEANKGQQAACRPSPIAGWGR